MGKIVEIKTDIINLDQLLKWANIVSTGGEAKILVTSGKVTLNGEVVLQRTKKIKDGDRIKVEGSDEFLVKKRP